MLALSEAGKSPTTINARLCALEECGLAIRSGKEGRNEIWKAITCQKTVDKLAEFVETSTK